MKLFKSLNFKSILLRFTIPYLFFIIFPIVVINFAPYKAMETIEKNYIDTSLIVLSHTSALIDEQIKTVDSISNQIFLDTELNELKYITKEKQQADHYKIWKSYNNIMKLSYLSDAIDLSIFYKGSNIYISPSFLCIDLEKSYGTLYKFGDSTFSEFKETYVNQLKEKTFFPNMTIVTNNHRSQGLLYAKKVFEDSPSYQGAIIYFLIKEDNILELCSPILAAPATLYILDQNDNLLFSNDSLLLPKDFSSGISLLEDTGIISPEVFGNHNIATYSLSNSGLKYIVVTPKNILFKQVKYLHILTLILNLIAAIIAISYALLLAFRNSKGILNLLSIMHIEEPSPVYTGENIFDYMNNTMSQIIHNNQSLRDNVKKQEPILRTALMDKLINGSLLDDNELHTFLNKLNIKVDNMQYCVLSILLEDIHSNNTSIENISQFITKKQSVLSVLEKDFSNQGYVYNQSMEQIVIVCYFSSTEAINYKQIIECLLANSLHCIYNSVEILINCIGSNLFSSIKNTFEHYNCCRQMLNHRILTNNESPILWYEPEINNTENTFIYSTKFETKLINQLKAGDAKGAQDCLEYILSKNLSAPTLTPIIQDIFISQIKITLYKCLEDIKDYPYAEKLSKLDSIKSPSSLRLYLITLINEVCGLFITKKSDKVDTIQKEMIEYINDNFNDPNLSLKSISDKFNLSDTYFSQLFKDLVGENFSTYLDRTRMLVADELLNSNKLKIHEISIKCGYNSTSTFRRAYKRFYGVSPSQKRSL